MNIFNLKIMRIKKYEEKIEKYEKEIKKLKEENDKEFWSYNRHLQEYKETCDFNYNKKLNELKAEIKKEYDFLREIRKILNSKIITDPKEYNDWLKCYYKIRNNIMNFKI